MLELDRRFGPLGFAPVGQRLNQRRCEEIVRRWKRGETRAQIAAAFGKTDSRMAAEIKRMRAAGWDLPQRNPRKSAHA